ncbi:MAG: hypothetical protein ACK4TB_11510 [Gemmobacter sp.]
MTDPLRPGDIVEIATPAGLGYVQVTHLHPACGAVVRGLPGLHPARPADLAALARAPAAFVALCQLAAQAGAGCARVGAAPLAAGAGAFPTFRLPIRDRQGAPIYWWFWDGEGLSLVPPPGIDPEALPLREITPLAALRARLAGGQPSA